MDFECVCAVSSVKYSSCKDNKIFPVSSPLWLLSECVLIEEALSWEEGMESPILTLLQTLGGVTCSSPRHY